MKKIIYLRYLISALFLVPSIGTAGNNHELHHDKKEIKQDKKVINYSQNLLDKLSTAIDYWHDAYLKGDRKKITIYEKKINIIIENDIKLTSRKISKAENEVKLSAIESKVNKGSKIARLDDKADLRNDKKDLIKASNLLKVKKRLLHGLRKGDSFSYKYRLLGDYQEIIRRELGIERIELVEDFKELHEDKHTPDKR
ncbi:MAG: hypothetical protein ACE5D6_02205 [Candidatus Zixiibacteriota bacterium]